MHREGRQGAAASNSMDEKERSLSLRPGAAGRRLKAMRLAFALMKPANAWSPFGRI